MKQKRKAKRLNPAHVGWCRNLAQMMPELGVWGIPRNGLVFQKQGDDLVLIGRQPFDSEMGVTERRWAEYQENELESTREHFAAAGVTVRDATISQTRH